MDDDEHESSVSWKWFCILAVTMVMVGVALYFLLPSLISKTETEMTIVKAVEEPFKVKPTDPSGKIVDHQNLLVVDILKGGTKDAEQTEILRPAAPNPEPPPVNVIVDGASKALDKVDKDTTAIDAEQNVVAAKGTERVSSNKSSNKQVAKGSKTSAEIVSKEANTKIKVVEKSVAKDLKPKKESEYEIEKRVTVIEGRAPLYMIQLAAFRSAKRAAEMAEILSQKHKSRLKDVDLETMRVDNGSNGIFHRIVSVPLLREEADKMCSILRRSGQDCFLRKYKTKSP